MQKQQFSIALTFKMCYNNPVIAERNQKIMKIRNEYLAKLYEKPLHATPASLSFSSL